MVCQVKVRQIIWMWQGVWPIICHLADFFQNLIYFAMYTSLNCVFVDGVRVLIIIIVMVFLMDLLYFHEQYGISVHTHVLM